MTPDTNTEPDDADRILADLERETQAMGPNVRTLDKADDAALDALLRQV